jgi:hypothetical protein
MRKLTKPMKKINILMIASIISCNLVLSQGIDYKGLPEWSKKTQGSTEYYIYTPKNLTPGQKYPIALFMHGCCGSDNVARLRNAVDPPVRMWHNFGENTQTVKMYIIAPATSSGWSQHFTNLKAVMDDIVATKQGDPQRIYVTGFSMGGGGTYDFINQYPTYVAAAIPMGMGFSGDVNKAKNIPFWANRGSLDSYCSSLPASVTQIRTLNGDNQGSYTWETGVNPMYSDFIGVGHGVQWDAASTQDLVGWALTKVNDGNYYPNVFFKSPTYKQVFTQKRIGVEITAGDNDGTIAKVELYVNGILKSTLNSSPYKDSVDLHPGDNILDAKAYDDKGKTNTSSMIVRMDNIPLLLNTNLPDARKGAFYLEKLYADGNGPFKFKVSARYNALPAGVTLQTDGVLRGIPQVTGSFNIGIVVTDENNDSTVEVLPLTVRAMNANELLVTNYQTLPVKTIFLSKLRNGDTPNMDAGNEINISNVSVFGGLTSIYPSNLDANSSFTEYMNFEVSENAIVRVAYEKMDCTLTTTVPSWLNGYTKDNTHEIVAQYRYFDVYSKNFPKGAITLPGANASANGVGFNYFVMVEKAGAINNTKPEVSNKTGMTAYIGHRFNDYLAILDGEGNMSWSFVSGSLPGGITLSKDGKLQGFPQSKGTFTFSLKVKDCNGDSLTSSFTITVKDFMNQIHAKLKDTAVMINTGVVTIPLNNISNGVSPSQNVTIQIIPDKSTVISVTNSVSTGGNNYSFTFTPKTDQAGITFVNVKIKDNNNTDTATNTTNNFIKVTVLSDKNHAPTCDIIADTSVQITSAKKTINFTGVTDGDGNVVPQTITASVSVTNLYTVINSPSVTYTKGSSQGTINFYPSGGTGTSIFTLKLKDNGGTDLGGIDTKTITFKVTVHGVDLDENQSGVSIFPNPFTDKVSVKINEVNNYQTISIVDATGRTMIMQGVKGDITEIDLSSLASGVYQLILDGAKGKYTTQIIKAN